MKYFFILFSFLFSSLTFSTELESFDDFITDFYASFSSRQLQKISEQHFHPNVQFIFGNHVMVPGNSKKVESILASIIKALEEDGYQKSVIRDISKTQSGSNFVVATVFFDRIKTNSEQLDSMCSTYSAVNLNGEWKILTWLPSKPKTETSCF
ncbi:hypothetical protein [Cognaticolwellia mytili]|uniref:hypothetical protein n=1 Tax=Cognaticolwellia mytili TaxID=1888913 RepID=UPI000A16EA04|nr:hypothetical protein [Cognaticolwellia mytili]